MAESSTHLTDWQTKRSNEHIIIISYYQSPIVNHVKVALSFGPKRKLFVQHR